MSRSGSTQRRSNVYRLKIKGSPKTGQSYNSLQNINNQNSYKGNLNTKNRTSLSELKNRNKDIENKLKVMDQQRKKLQLHDFKTRKNSQQADEKTFQKKFQRIMRKDEKVEYAIEKIQRDFMRYTQLKINGFKTLMGGDRLDENDVSPKKSSRFHNNLDGESPNRGELSHKNKRKNNNKSSLSFAGKLVMLEEKRGRGVGFEAHSAM